MTLLEYLYGQKTTFTEKKVFQKENTSGELSGAGKEIFTLKSFLHITFTFSLLFLSISSMCLYY